jgi:hypothetical protein
VKDDKTYRKEVKGIDGLTPIRITKNGISAIAWIHPNKVNSKIEEFQEKGYNPIKQIQT